MTQEEKELLLKDLCARLPYGVIVKDRNAIHELSTGNTEFVDLFNGKCHIKPYLRPMSSMTDEEAKGIGEFLSGNFYVNIIDWLNAHHFDYRGLLEEGLALEAPEDMYKIE